jgi:DNA replication and repair protein RecF
LLAIKLSLYKYIKESKGIKPILLLDDLFDKLDATRVVQLIAIISTDDFGQVFITDTDKNRILNSFEGKDELLDCFTIDNNGD